MIAGRKPKSRARQDYAAIARRYAEWVVSGTMPACGWVKKACRRQLDGAVSEVTCFGVIYTIDDGDAWSSAATFYGISVFPADIRRLSMKDSRCRARRTTSSQSD